MIEIKKINEDSRGQMYGYSLNGRQHIIVTYNSGKSRGGHYHQTHQWHIVLGGRFRVSLHDMNTGEERVREMQEGDSMYIPAGIAHLFEALEESVMAESRSGDYEATEYEPFRKLARP